MSPETIVPEKPTNKLNVQFDLKWVCVALLVVIVALLLAWRPWNRPVDNSRTVSVTGEATITATPDEFVFNPSYEFKNADKTVALKDLTTKSNELVPKLKALGVASNKIKTDSNGYDQGVYYYNYDETDKSYTYTLSLTVTVGTAKLAQTVQDYLVTTTPSGAVSPTAQFSTATQKKLEAQARDAATKEARSKADQLAKNLGFSVGKVKSINDTGFDGGIQSYLMSGSDIQSAVGSAPKLDVQPGQNDLSYSITVAYYVR